MIVVGLMPKASDLATPETWPDLVDSYYEKQFRLTLGRLISRLKSLVTIPADLENLLEKSLDRRNWLMHQYFRERAIEFLSLDGRDAMVSELESMQMLFAEADEALDKVIKPLRIRFGLTDQMLEICQREMLKAAGLDRK
jgi:hypothetical protein